MGTHSPPPGFTGAAGVGGCAGAPGAAAGAIGVPDGSDRPPLESPVAARLMPSDGSASAGRTGMPRFNSSSFALAIGIRATPVFSSTQP